MTVRLVSDASNVLAFPGETRARPSVELLMELAPSRSLVATLTAERGEPPHDAWAGFAREFAFQARTLEIGHGQDVAIMRLRALVDAHIAHAVELCRVYHETADRMVSLEVRAARAERVTSSTMVALRAARAETRDHAIAARAAADAALGAAAALATYIREELGALPVSTTSRVSFCCLPPRRAEALHPTS
jgi:hypothetical protein